MHFAPTILYCILTEQKYLYNVIVNIYLEQLTSNNEKISNLCPPQLHHHQETLAIRILVVPMPIPQCEAPVASAHVAQNTLETPTLAAGRNVSSTLTVTGHLPAEETTNATTLALEHAASTLSAK